MNDQQTITTVKMAEGLSVWKILLFIMIVVGLAGSGLYFMITRVISSTNISLKLPEISIPENPLGDIASISDLAAVVEQAANTISQNLQNANVAQTGDAANSAEFTPLGDKILYKQEGSTLTVVSGGGTSFTFISDIQEPRFWIGAIHDPYQPLVNLAGTPFFSGEGLPIKPADNIVRITDSAGNFTVTAKTFKPFPFFSEEPTTIGIIEGFYDMDSLTSRLRFTFIDMERSLSAQIESEEMSFPQWFKKGGFPPSYATQKYIMLHPKNSWFGSNVYMTLQKFRDGAYEFQSDAFRTLSVRELSKVPLSPEDLKVLRKADLNNPNYEESSTNAVRKLVAFAYYSKVTNQQDTIRALYPHLHKSLQTAINATPEISLQ